eukprot:CAMPEP_0169083462 /NCGR_PEP_ID=MMETSP1015-20121227/12092_1 /TAXON_ID=342587 /ORGANISM="Karlodinium micrum, Strain CCMP2283" /LENGTH=130 /DNA_ID=CAMNT_0009143389 /DNA_START=490 /DNA_END=882 /DNA_ORIENTATION=-
MMWHGGSLSGVGHANEEQSSSKACGPNGEELHAEAPPESFLGDTLTDDLCPRRFFGDNEDMDREIACNQPRAPFSISTGTSTSASSSVSPRKYSSTSGEVSNAQAEDTTSFRLFAYISPSCMSRSLIAFK